MVGTTKDIFDIFGDGSALELIQMNGNLHTHSHGDLTVNSGTVSYVDGVFDQTIEETSSIDVGYPNPTFIGNSGDFTISAFSTITGIIYNEDGVINIHELSYVNDIDLLDYDAPSWREELDFSLHFIHLAYVKSGDYIDFYINGLLAATGVPAQYQNANSRPAEMCAARESNNHITDQWRFFNRALTQREIKMLAMERNLNLAAPNSTIGDAVVTKTEPQYDAGRMSIVPATPIADCGDIKLRRKRPRASLEPDTDAMVVKAHD